jgi:Cd2+/Zn2+-exporting ATPase
MAEAAARALDARYTAAQVVESMAGRGVRGRLNGSEVVVGSHAMFHETRQDCQGFHEAVRSAEAAGQTVVLVGRDGVLQGFISVADRVRPATAPALRSLKELNPSYRIIMLTGDNQTVASVIASEIGAIDEVFSGLLPGDKAGAVQSLEARHGRVAMVGDGINDAPALAQASVGIAMGGTGSDQAMETANVVLMQDDLSHLPDLLRTSSRAERIIRQNIAFSLAIKGLFLLLTLPGLATMWMAVFADMGASLLVTFNGMRMLARDRGRQ